MDTKEFILYRIGIVEYYLRDVELLPYVRRIYEKEISELYQKRENFNK